VSRPGILETGMLLGMLAAADAVEHDDTKRMALLARKAVALLAPDAHEERAKERAYQVRMASSWATSRTAVHRLLVINALHRLDIISAEGRAAA
jgi:hypothetical protein